MQVALNFGKATYFDKPILSVDDAFATYPEYTMEELAPRLIAELEPYRNVPFPSFVEGVIPVRFIIGDLYLWSGSFTNSTQFYELAANEYYKLMLENIWCKRPFDLQYNQYCIYRRLFSLLSVQLSADYGPLSVQINMATIINGHSRSEYIGYCISKIHRKLDVATIHPQYDSGYTGRSAYESLCNESKFI
jgi:hypothetical protein